jgi:hypothetical protein
MRRVVARHRRGEAEVNCTRCGETGFLNVELLPDDVRDCMDVNDIEEWIRAHDDHDVQVCDCCGDGEGWYGEPGQHRETNGKWDSGHVPHCI